MGETLIIIRHYFVKKGLKTVASPSIQRCQIKVKEGKKEEDKNKRMKVNKQKTETISMPITHAI